MASSIIIVLVILLLILLWFLLFKKKAEKTLNLFDQTAQCQIDGDYRVCSAKTPPETYLDPGVCLSCAKGCQLQGHELQSPDGVNYTGSLIYYCGKNDNK